MSLLSRRELECQEFVELATPYLEGTLSTRGQRRADRHLSACDGCRAYLEQVRETVRLTGRLEPEALPDAARAKLLAVFRTAARDGS